jgi:hypothetical protein
VLLVVVSQRSRAPVLTEGKAEVKAHPDPFGRRAGSGEGYWTGAGLSTVVADGEGEADGDGDEGERTSRARQGWYP